MAPAPVLEFLSAHRAQTLRATADPVFWDVRARTDYVFSHIPGALGIDWRTFRDPDAGRTARWHPSLRVLEALVGAAGLTTERPVVIYGDPEAGGADGWIAWLLWYVGHTQIAILDGGWPAWRRIHGPSEVGPVEPTAALFHAQPRHRALAEREEIASGLRTGAIRVIDTSRAKDIRNPRIVSAIHVPWTIFRRTDGSKVSDHVVGEVLASHGVNPAARVIISAAVGEPSAWVWSVLTAWGCSDVGHAPEFL
ncbi:MAG: rhodanese-like domain-containing protein [Nitrospiria bacterium]